MTIEIAKIPIEVDDLLILDGEHYDVLGRKGGAAGRDTFVVDGPNGEEDWHVDEFADRARKANEIEIRSWEVRESER